MLGNLFRKGSKFSRKSRYLFPFNQCVWSRGMVVVVRVMSVVWDNNCFLVVLVDEWTSQALGDSSLLWDPTAQRHGIIHLHQQRFPSASHLRVVTFSKVRTVCAKIYLVGEAHFFVTDVFLGTTSWFFWLSTSRITSPPLHPPPMRRATHQHMTVSTRQISPHQHIDASTSTSTSTHDTSLSTSRSTDHTSRQRQQRNTTTIDLDITSKTATEHDDRHRHKRQRPVHPDTSSGWGGVRKSLLKGSGFIN